MGRSVERPLVSLYLIQGYRESSGTQLEEKGRESETTDRGGHYLSPITINQLEFISIECGFLAGRVG